MEMTVEKRKIMIMSRQPSTIQIMTDQKQLGNLEHFNYFGSMISMLDVYAKLNPGFPWRKQHST
jgi:hypothetical protein